MSGNNLSNDKLQPEYIRALSVLDTHLHKLVPSNFTNVNHDIYSQGNLVMFCDSFATRYIPSDTHWRWNQTRSRKSTYLPGHNLYINIIKLIPRKRNVPSTEIVPLYKLWMFELSQTPGSKHPFATVMWCERGTVLNPMFPSVTKRRHTTTQRKNSIDFLGELSFLADFMQPELANSLWGQKNNF